MYTKKACFVIKVLQVVDAYLCARSWFVDKPPSLGLSKTTLQALNGMEVYRANGNQKNPL